MVTDATLGGYFEQHQRPPAFGGRDGHAYSVDLYIDQTPEEGHSYSGALLFIRWSSAGDRPVGHAETDWLISAASEREVRNHLLSLSLERVKAELDKAVAVVHEDR